MLVDEVESLRIDNAEKDMKLQQNEEKKSDVKDHLATIAMMIEQIESLRKDNEEKDRKIREMEKRIEELMEVIGSIHELVIKADDI